jgi:hypothetical protein
LGDASPPKSGGAVSRQTGDPWHDGLAEALFAINAGDYGVRRSPGRPTALIRGLPDSPSAFNSSPWEND